jgi:diacylglycerol kinase
MKRPLIVSFACAFRGIGLAFQSERNFRIHAAAMCVVVALGLYLGLSALEWCLAALASGCVLVAELFNTAIERLGDEAAGGAQKEMVGKAKDLSAAAVLLSALTALTIGVFVLLVPLARRLFGLF